MKKLISILVLAAVVLTIIPISMLSVSAEATELSVEWINKNNESLDEFTPYNPAGSNAGGVYISTAGAFKYHNSAYVFSKVIAIPDAGTTVSFTETGTTSTGAAPVSVWAKAENYTGTNDATDYVFKMDGKATVSKNTETNKTTYTYTTVKDNELIRLCFNGDIDVDSTGNVSNKVYKSASIDSTTKIATTSVLKDDGTVGGVTWNTGYVNASGCQNGKNNYNYSSLIAVPAGVTLTFVDSITTSIGNTTNGYCSNGAFSFSSFVNETTLGALKIAGGNTDYYTADTEANTRTFVYTNVTEYTQYIRISYRSSETSGVWPTEHPDVTWSSESIQTLSGASARLTNEYGTSGLRFRAVISREIYDNYVTQYGASNVKVGTLITVKANKDAVDEMTHASLDALSVSNGGKITYLDVNAEAPYASDDDSYTFVGSVVNIKNENLTKEYYAVSYIKVNGTYIYSTSDSEGRSVEFVANSAFEDVEATASDVYVNLINDANDEFNGKYSPFTAAERAVLKQLIG